MSETSKQEVLTLLYLSRSVVILAGSKIDTVALYYIAVKNLFT